MSDGFETRDEKGQEPGQDAFVREWLEAIDLASEDEKPWRDDAENAIRIYDTTERTENSFNILHSNQETLLPAIYNTVPVPDVRRRYNDKDPPGKLVADTLERALSFSVDAYDFDDRMQQAVADLALPGRGVLRVRYEPSIEGEGGAERVVYQSVTCEHVDWSDYRQGPAKSWERVPWVAFRHFLSRRELKAKFGEKGTKVQLDSMTRPTSEKDPDKPPPGLYGRAETWEIWDREAKEVIFIARGYGEGPLNRIKDPLGLDGFFPNPRPMQAIRRRGSLTPVCPYEVYKSLAEELNLVTRRIAKIVAQLKVRGIYASADGGDIKTLESADDGEMIPATSIAHFANQGGLEKAVLFWPLEPAVKALQQLYAQRDQIKQTIYEVTGIADILRGSTQASETATAQQIKAQWGSLRIQRMQQEVARFARDIYRLKAEIMAKHFTPEMLQMMTQVQLTPEAQELMKTATVAYRIDIETDSTIRADQTRMQEQMNNFLMGTAQFAQAAMGIIQIAPEALPVVVEVYASFARNFNLQKSAEDALETLSEIAKQAAQQGGQQKPDPKAEAEKAKAEAATTKAKLDIGVASKKAEIEISTLQQKQQLAQGDLAIKQQKLEMDAQALAVQRALPPTMNGVGA
jgi:hypothetical protein